MIPAYDRESTIGRSLDCLVEQTFAGWEAIVVDDGSSDGTAAVVEAHARRDSRFRLHVQAENGGVSAARNAGIALARHPWLFFLDADDWIVPTALQALVYAAERGAEGVSAVYGGYVRVDEDGRELRERHPEHAEDLFPLFAKSCAFAIHTCLIRTELVRAVGGFDETLATCEDWDLWQKVARAGARFAAIPDYIAYYRMRFGSASANGARMLGDGLQVIERGHGEDPRLADAHPAHRLGAPASAKSLARAYFACYTAGLAMAGGVDARWMLDELGPTPASGLHPHGVAETLFYAVPNGRGTVPESWPSFPPEIMRRCGEFIDALGAWTQEHWLSFQTRRAFEQMVLGVAGGARPRTVGAWHLAEIDCDAGSPAPLLDAAGVEHALYAVRFGSSEIDSVELPVCDGWLPARVIADGVVVELAWSLMRARLARDVYPTLAIERDGDRVRVSRAGRTLLEDDVPPDRPFEEWLHDAIGWTLLLQELWARPTWSSDDFYSEKPEPEPDADMPGVPAESESEREPGIAREPFAGKTPVAVELAEPLPLVRCSAESAAIAVTLAGIPLVSFRLPAANGLIAPHEIRRTTLMRLGFELCRAVLRELMLAPGEEPRVAEPGSACERPSMRETLAFAAAARARRPEPVPRWAEGSAPRALVPGWHRALAELCPPDTSLTAIGRRATGADGTAVSRCAVLPRAAHEELLAAARSGGDPVLELGAGPSAGHVLYAPCVEWDRSAACAPEGIDEALLVQLEFEQAFAARPDPWSYASDYEQRKYEQTLALVPAGVHSALELGCAEGAFTAQLAACVPEVLACDISTIALSRAARRCSHLPNVAFTRLDAFEQELPRGHGLIVCSEMLYYASSHERLQQTARRIARALAPGGCLLTANAHALVDDRDAAGFDWDVPFGAKRIGETILATGLFDLEREVRTDPYRIQAFRRRVRRRVLSTRATGARVSVEGAQAGAMTPEAASRFAPRGGSVRVEDEQVEAVGAERLPILMYHRIAAEGSPRTQRWRLHPDELDRQLAYLREAGYYSVTFEQWRAAVNMRRPLPGKPIVLTFDDGYADFVEHAAPLLQRHGFRAVVYVVSELVGQSNVWDEALGEPLALMDWQTIGRLSAEGIDFGSHTARHRALVALDQEQLAADLARSKRLLGERLGHPVTSVSYPFGLHDATVVALAGACGYEYGVTTDEWPASWSDHLLRLPRLEVRGTDALEDFAKMLQQS